MDIDAILRGGSQGATMGFGDELAAAILDGLPAEDDGTGIPRIRNDTQYNEYRDETRADNRAARERAPWQYGGGAVAGGLPLAVATSPLAGGATGAARIAAGGLQGGALGGIAGAGDSEREGQGLARDAALGAGVGGALGVAAPAAIEGLASARNFALSRLSPAMAGAGADAAGVSAPAAQELGGAQVVKAMPPAPGSEIVPGVEVPRMKALGTRKTSFQDARGETVHDVDVPYATGLDKTVRPPRGKARAR